MVAVPGLFGPARVAGAAVTLTVTTTADGGPGSLRAAMAAASSNR